MRACMHAQVAGLAKSVQDRKAELDAEVRQQGLLMGAAQQQQQQPAHVSDDLLLSEPIRFGPVKREPGPQAKRSPAELFPGLNTSTPSGCVRAPTQKGPDGASI